MEIKSFKYKIINTSFGEKIMYFCTKGLTARAQLVSTNEIDLQTYEQFILFFVRCLTEGSSEHFMIMEVGQKIPFETAVGVNGRIWLYTGFEKSQNLLYSLFRDAEAADGDKDVIHKATSRVIQEISAMSDDIPLEDNTQYWVTRVV